MHPNYINILIGRWLAILTSLLVLELAHAQVAVPVGAGSYASEIPAAYQFSGGFFSMTAQQVVNYYTNLHLVSSLTNRPIPTSKWWTDILVADRSYQPGANQPRVIQQNSFGGQLWAYPVMLAPNSSGFNLYFPNAWTPSGSDPAVPIGNLMTGTALPITGGVPASVGSNDILIADFNGTSYAAGWVTTGTAFGAGPLVGGTWPGELPALTGYLGNACVNSYYGSSDTPTGTLASARFTVQKKYIHLLVAGGSDTNNTAVKFLIGTNVIYAAVGQQDGTLRWTTWDVSAYLGNTNAQIKFVDNANCCWGFIACSWIVASDDGSSPASRYNGSFSPLHSEVTDWSDWGVQFGLPDAQGRRMDIALARGVPFVWTTYTSLKPQIGCGAATLYATNGGVISTSTGSFTNSAFAFDYQGRTFGVFAPDNTIFLLTNSVIEAELSGTNNYLVYGLLPSRTNLAEFAQYAFARVTNTTYAWTYDIPNGRVVTTWNLAASPLKNGQTNTLQGWLPHHYRTTVNALAFKPYNYLTPRGLMKVASGNQFQISYNFRGIAPVLPAPHTNNLANDYIASRMTNFILGFAASYPYTVTNLDTYGAGKNYALSAQYMTFARQMGMTNQVASLANGIKNLLANWFTYTPGEASFFFARYGNWPGLIGFPASYGSEAFNDNHFHYGYFLDATALVGMEDTNFLAQYGPMARLVAKEYANWDRADTSFPFLRTFDIWEGHSWASGFSSATGQNEESSSEDMNSWVGLFLLGNQLGDSVMTAAGAMGYAVESTAVNEYWQDMYQTNLPASYGKGGVGIVHSDSVQYGTFFSGDPAWIYGIQWVPANHWNNYLCRDKVFANWQLTNMWNERVVASAHGINGFTLTDANNAVSQGEYLGNYMLGYQTLFDSDGVAALFDAAYATNAAIATGPNWSGATYYFTHALRGLGNQDLNYYTSLPTSQVYYNSRTGQRTYAIYNPAPTNQTAMIYSNSIPVDSVTALAGKLTVRIAGQSNVPSQISVSIQTGGQISWPTTANTSWTLQAANTLGTNAAWAALLGPAAGDGTTNTLFDLLWPAQHKQYQVLTIISGSSNIVVNGGFEAGSGLVASNWSAIGTQPPMRINTDFHGGSYSMQLWVTNTATIPNTSEIAQDIGAVGGIPVVAGQSYNFSFWAKQISYGVSYVQNYRISWLTSSGSTISMVDWTGFSAGNGVWTQVTVNNLVAPANAVNAYLQIYGATGAVLNGSGSVLIDDVSLSYSTPSQTNKLSAAVQPGIQVSWPSTSGKSYDVRWTENLSGNNWSNLVSSLPANGVTNAVSDVFGTNPLRFYRVVELP